MLRVASGIIGFVIVIVIWQIVAVGPMAGSSLPSATSTFAQLAAVLPTPSFWDAVWQTVTVAIGGLILAIVVGVILGMVIATSRVTMFATRAILEFLKPIPPIVILPLVVLTLGPTAQMGIFLVFFGCVFPIVMQTAAGVFDADPVAIATARSFSLSRFEILLRVILPSAGSFIGTAIRVTAPASLIIAVVAGLIGGGPGLGQSLLHAQLSGSQASLFAYVAVLGLLGLVIQGVTTIVERRVLHWHPSYRKGLR